MFQKSTEIHSLKSGGSYYRNYITQICTCYQEINHNIMKSKKKDLNAKSSLLM